ncbi:MAG: cell division protein FtsB [Acidimicrobiales bacterium]|jgi:cell division protein FtsB
MKFGKKNTYKDYIYSRPVIGVLLLIIFFLIMSVYERYGVERDMSERRALSETELEQLYDRKGQLEDRVQHLEGERGIEEEIRKNFDVAREGEQVIILVGDERVETDVVQEIVSKKEPWYKFWR